MRTWLAGAGFALFIGACAGGAVPGIMMVAAAPAATVEASLADVRRPEGDRERDALRHPADVMAFIGIQPGWRIADIGPGGGYYTRLFSVAVGAEGRVFAVDRPNTITRQRAILEVAPLYPNITVLQDGYEAWRPDEPLDAIFISQIYHDFHDPLHLDVAAANRAMFEALKPGGALIVIDHAAPDGSDVSVTSSLHRIDQAQVVRELTAAGFVLEDESQLLRNPDDDRSARVFEGDIRGRTDQFVMRFRKSAA
jgi:predicted methyltransferase